MKTPKERKENVVSIVAKAYETQKSHYNQIFCPIKETKIKKERVCPSNVYHE
jgi:hypothetical protein